MSVSDEAIAVRIPSEGRRMPRPPILDMYEMAMRRTDVEFRFEFVKMVIISDKYWIDMAETEKETYGRYKNATFFILACLDPLMEEDAGKKFMKEYKALCDAAEACDPVEVLGTYNEGEVANECYYNLTGTLKIRKKEKKEGGDEEERSEDSFGSGMGVPAPESKYDSAVQQASENAYSMANCEAKKQYLQALRLAFRLKLVNPREVHQLDKDKPSADKILRDR